MFQTDEILCIYEICWSVKLPCGTNYSLFYSILFQELIEEFEETYNSGKKSGEKRKADDKPGKAAKKADTRVKGFSRGLTAEKIIGATNDEEYEVEANNNISSTMVKTPQIKLATP